MPSSRLNKQQSADKQAELSFVDKYLDSKGLLIKKKSKVESLSKTSRYPSMDYKPKEPPKLDYVDLYLKQG